MQEIHQSHTVEETYFAGNINYKVQRTVTNRTQYKIRVYSPDR